MRPIFYLGNEALSPTRRRALAERAAGLSPNPFPAAWSARHLFLLEPEDSAVQSDDIGARIGTLLDAQPLDRAPDTGFVVAPRQGSVSPWSSKATDIFRNCGITAIRRVECAVWHDGLSPETLGPALSLFHDRMTQSVYRRLDAFFERPEPPPYTVIDIMQGGREALERANVELGLALSAGEMNYLVDAYRRIGRNPTDVELVMFGQVNSEHCRHKIFNANWRVDGRSMERTLFAMIRNTHERHPGITLVAYSDNAAIVEGHRVAAWQVNQDGSRRYERLDEQLDIVIKVETHNHPTAICPYPGAATGVGGEIRDEAATGVGARSKAGLAAYMVSNLRIPGYPMPWERVHAAFPSRLAAPLDIMLEAPIGGARFGNEFGRPQLFGLFRTYEDMAFGRYRGYHKPIMAAGGMGNIKRRHIRKHTPKPGSLVIQLGGPALRIGLGGGAASSMDTGSNAEDLDFDSVQRDNAEMQRRCQEAIDACVALADDNPILTIHDIGAGGLSNGCPELLAETGGLFHLRAIHNEDRSMSPMEIWCCEAQERYVLAIEPARLTSFLELCKRERCPAAIIGIARHDGRLILEDCEFNNKPIDIDVGVILGKPPRMQREVARLPQPSETLSFDTITVDEALDRVLRLPAVAAKTFLIAIADRTVSGLVARDQMVGPWQIPVADVAMTTTSLDSYSGEAMSMGERAPLALLSPRASGRMAVAEALLNLCAAPVGDIERVRLSANWMCACGEPGEDAALFDTVEAVGMEFCPQLGISIPVGKDSLSMRTVWNDGPQKIVQSAPLSLIVSAFAPVSDVRPGVTPDLKPGASRLLLIDLGEGKNRLGASALAQVTNQVGTDAPDIDSPARLRALFAAIQELIAHRRLAAYHDRSDGGLAVAVIEMAIAGRRGVSLSLDDLGGDAMAALFSEEAGAVLQVRDTERDAVLETLNRHTLGDVTHEIGAVTDNATIAISMNGKRIIERSVLSLAQAWHELSFRMRSLRDNPEAAREEYESVQDETDPGLTARLTYNPDHAPTLSGMTRPRIAVLREQGINGQREMAHVFDVAGFESIDMHMTDLISGRDDLSRFQGLVACGGFSYGDVLGAGTGWARSILYNEKLAEMFAAFFLRPDTFTLGVCNGCQMVAQLRNLIPGAGHWPLFKPNRSAQFEARLVTVRIESSPSVLLAGMEDSRLPIPIAHGEGRAEFDARHNDTTDPGCAVAMRYVDNAGAVTQRYPYNPNGSPDGIAGVTSLDGRATILMPHPERAYRRVQLSYCPDALKSFESGPWLRLFRNARAFVA